MFLQFGLVFILTVSTIKADNLSSSELVEAKLTKDLVLDAFETLRRLIQESSSPDGVKDSDEKTSPGAQHYSPFQQMDPLFLPKPCIHETRDYKSPIPGKMVIKLDNLQFSGLSEFKVEQVANNGPCLNFQHVIPKLDACADYTIDYNLFNEIPLRISSGQLKATLPRVRVRGGFLSFSGPMNDWSNKSKFNVSTSVEDNVTLAVYPKNSISEKFVLSQTFDKFEAALISNLPQMSEILKNAYSRVIEMKLIQ